MLKETEIAYLSGFIDGEGSIRFQTVPLKNTNRQYLWAPRPEIKISSTDHDILLWIQSIFGGYLCDEKNLPENRKETWHWGVSGKKAVKLIMTILPYLRIKKFQAELALKVVKRERITVNGKWASGLSEKEKEHNIKLRNDMYKLNGRKTG